mgnify:CR=1 FL=1
MDKNSGHIEFAVGDKKINLYMSFDGTVNLSQD